MDPITALAGAQTSIKAVLGLAKVAASAVVDHQVKDKMIEIQQAILDVQSKLGDAQEERLSLLHQAADLREKLRVIEATKAALDSYELCEMSAGLLLYRSRASAGHSIEHFACPTCHNAGKVAVMQATKSGSQQKRYRCAVCKFDMRIGPSDPAPPRRTAGWVQSGEW